MTPHTPARYALLVLFALALTVSACGGGGGDTPAGGEDATSTDNETADAETAPSDLFDTNFAQVCRGTGLAQAAAYTAGPGVHPILFMRSDDGADYMGNSVTLPEGWGAQWPDLARTELVGCIRRVSASPVAPICEGYKDDDTGVEWTVQNHDVVYEYVVRVAQTGAEVGRQTFEVPSGACPMFSMFSQGEPQPQPYYPSLGTGEVEVFVRPFVMGTAEAAPMSGQTPGA